VPTLAPKKWLWWLNYFHIMFICDVNTWETRNSRAINNSFALEHGIYIPTKGNMLRTSLVAYVTRNAEKGDDNNYESGVLGSC